MTLSEIPVKNIPTKALVIEKPGAPFVLEDVILDEVRDDEVLVEMRYTGLCHTDIVVQHGGMPFGEYPAILGHEGAGIVRRVGALVKNKSLKVGDSVLLSFHSCRKCSYCSEGRLGMCSSISEINFTGVRVSDGSSPASRPKGGFIRGQFFGQSSFSKFAIVAEDSVLKCDASDRELALMAPLGCGYFTGAGTVFNVLKPTKATTIAIFGMGGVGLAALMAAKAVGVSRIIAVDMIAAKLELALSLGATDVINTVQQPDIHAAITEVTELGVDQVLDSTGVPKLIEMGIKSLCHGGTLALVGVPRPGSSLTLDPMDFLVSCKRLIGVIEAASNPAQLVPKLIQLYHDGKFPLDQIGKIYPVSSLDEAIKDMHSGAVVKPILAWDGV